MYKYLKINFAVLLIIIGLLIVGTLFILISGENFIKLFSYLASIFLEFIGIMMIVLSFKNKKYFQAKTIIDTQIGYIIQGVILLALGVLIIIFPEYLVRAAIGVTLIVIPTLQLYLKEDKKGYFLQNIWKYIVGLILIIAIDIVVEIMFIVFGVILYLASIYLIYLLIKNYHEEDKPNILSKYIIAYIIKRSYKE